MPPFNAEIASKAQEKRMDALEKFVQGLQTSVKQNDSAAVLKKELNALDTRIANLEKMVKVLVETRDSSKLEAMDKILKVTAETSVKRADLDKLVAAHAGSVFAAHMSKMQVNSPDAKAAIDKAIEAERKRYEQEKREMQSSISKLDQARETLRKDMKDEQERKWKEAEKERQAEIARLRQEQEKQIKSQIDQMKLDSRFQVLEAQLKGLGAQLNAVAAAAGKR